jgi:hypothetical protein
LMLAFMQPNAISETSNVPSFRFFMVFHSSLQPIELRFICGSPILSNRCLFVRTL